MGEVRNAAITLMQHECHSIASLSLSNQLPWQLSSNLITISLSFPLSLLSDGSSMLEHSNQGYG